jgi:hypothetical protein
VQVIKFVKIFHSLIILLTLHRHSSQVSFSKREFSIRLPLSRSAPYSRLPLSVRLVSSFSRIPLDTFCSNKRAPDYFHFTIACYISSSLALHSAAAFATANDHSQSIASHCILAMNRLVDLSRTRQCPQQNQSENWLMHQVYCIFLCC